MIAAAFGEVTKTLGLEGIRVAIRGIPEANRVEGEFARRVGVGRGTLEQLLSCDRVAGGPERCDLESTRAFLEIDILERRPDLSVVKIHSYEVHDGELGETVWTIEVRRSEGKWQFSRTLSLMVT